MWKSSGKTLHNFSTGREFSTEYYKNEHWINFLHRVFRGSSTSFAQGFALGFPQVAAGGYLGNSFYPPGGVWRGKNLPQWV